MFYCLLPIALKLYLIAGAKIGSADFPGWFEAVHGICDEALRQTKKQKNMKTLPARIYYLFYI